MPRPYVPVIPQTIGELMDHLGMMMLKSPTFRDDLFVHRNVETVFSELTQGLDRVRKRLGEDRYAATIELARRMRTHFEADPADTNGETAKGRRLLREIEDLVTKRAAPR